MNVKRAASSDEIRSNGAPVRSKRLGDSLHTHAVFMHLDNLVDLGFSEESLSFPNRSDDSTPFVSNGRFEGALILLIEAAPPPRDNGFQGRGKVLKVSTQGHIG